MKISNNETSLLFAIQGAVGKGGCKREQDVVFKIDNFSSTRFTHTLTNLYLVSEEPQQMALQAKSQMKFTLNWIIVNFTEFLLMFSLFFGALPFDNRVANSIWDLSRGDNNFAPIHDEGIGVGHRLKCGKAPSLEAFLTKTTKILKSSLGTF